MNRHQHTTRNLAVALGVCATACLATLLWAPPIAHAHQGHTDRAPWDACATRVLDDPCEWTDRAHARYIGTCRQVADALLCVRNQPVVLAPHVDEGSGTTP